MLRPRIIPCLLVQDGGLVKTVRFKNPKYVGDPINAVKIFNEKRADELIVVDIDATSKGLEPNYKMISNLAMECRMPLCYGGGIRNVAQAKKIISLGVEKVALSSAAVNDMPLITHISQEVGRQSVVVVLDVKKRLLGRTFEVWTHNGTRNTKKEFLEVAREAEQRGAGEIVVNSIDDDGQMSGYDMNIVRSLRDAVNIPITVLGGAGSLGDICKVIQECGTVGVAAGSLFVFKGSYKAVLISYPDIYQKDDLIRNSLRT